MSTQDLKKAYQSGMGVNWGWVLCCPHPHHICHSHNLRLCTTLKDIEVARVSFEGAQRELAMKAIEVSKMQDVLKLAKQSVLEAEFKSPGVIKSAGCGRNWSSFHVFLLEVAVDNYNNPIIETILSLSLSLSLLQIHSLFSHSLFLPRDPSLHNHIKISISALFRAIDSLNNLRSA
ncbi:hypothetical protein RJT34_18038 [Clitoria ternatea]|uniref:Uncharacterized protein n=1 Tax=Clitoria ternatea TaxID=43366 RepID=A0AAN9JD63_CLITE